MGLYFHFTPEELDALSEIAQDELDSQFERMVTKLELEADREDSLKEQTLYNLSLKRGD